jgi:hypothetical protein
LRWALHHCLSELSSRRQKLLNGAVVVFVVEVAKHFFEDVFQGDDADWLHPVDFHGGIPQEGSPVH